jgi:hypothetical protein
MICEAFFCDECGCFIKRANSRTYGDDLGVMGKRDLCKGCRSRKYNIVYKRSDYKKFDDEVRFDEVE